MEDLSNVNDVFTNQCTENTESDELMNVCVSSNSNNDDDDINWGDCDDKLRCLFDQVLMILLRGVHVKNRIRPIPALLGDGNPVDLFKLFCLVRDRGSFRSVSEDKLWGLIAEKFKFDYKLCASLKLIYYKYLDELDQWLNRITRDNGRFEYGGNLSLLSLELEKRFREFSADVKELGAKDGVRGFYEVCNHISEVFNDTLHLPDVENENENENGSKLPNGVIICDIDDDENLCKDKEFIGEGSKCSLDSSRKRKRDMFLEMLSWMKKIAKNPYYPSEEKRVGCSLRKGNEEDDFRSLALSIREARLHRRYPNSNSNYQESSLQQKKISMHPSMYEDDPPRSLNGGLRSSQRLISMVKTPLCPCCKPSSTSTSINQCNLDTPSENKPQIGKRGNKKLHTTKKISPPTNDDDTHVFIGPRFQANVRIWTGSISESDPKWLGTQIWIPDPQESGKPGKGRSETCKCGFPGSVECHRFHIAENRFKLRKKLGLAFFHWKFNRMGEEVSLSWTVEDEKKFKHVIKLTTPYLGISYFPKKKSTDLVSYYFNVYLINRRRYQNRVTPNEIDSDDDEKEFGSVGEAFGYNAVKVPRSEHLTCYENQQVFDLD